jgi:hypothetical protein
LLDENTSNKSVKCGIKVEQYDNIKRSGMSWRIASGIHNYRSELILRAGPHLRPRSESLQSRKIPPHFPAVAIAADLPFLSRGMKLSDRREGRREPCGALAMMMVAAAMAAMAVRRRRRRKRRRRTGGREGMAADLGPSRDKGKGAEEEDADISRSPNV